MLSIDEVSTKEVNRTNEILENDVIAKYNNDIKLIDEDTRITLERLEVLLSARQAQALILRNVL